MTARNFKIDQICYIFDTDETPHRWIKHKIIKVNETTLTLEDIDKQSDWEGMKFDITEDEINDKTYFKIK